MLSPTSKEGPPGVGFAPHSQEGWMELSPHHGWATSAFLGELDPLGISPQGSKTGDVSRSLSHSLEHIGLTKGLDGCLFPVSAGPIHKVRNEPLGYPA